MSLSEPRDLFNPFLNNCIKDVNGLLLKDKDLNSRSFTVQGTIGQVIYAFWNLVMCNSTLANYKQVFYIEAILITNSREMEYFHRGYESFKTEL